MRTKFLVYIYHGFYYKQRMPARRAKKARKKQILSGSGTYRPEPLPIASLEQSRLITSVGQANFSLARYDGLLHSLVNPEVMLSPMTTREAVLSSRIEGTQATLEEVLEHDAGGESHEKSKHDDIFEIINYRLALRSGEQDVTDRPIRLSTVRSLHKLLMQGARGESKTPGEFRVDQNWIGRQGCKMEEASFIPPSPLHMSDALKDWEHYLSTQDIDPIVQTAVMHAQFELIHPFRDGNGRVGRLLIPLFLYRTGRLSRPMFYLSGYLEEHRDEYYARLQAISEGEDWNGWVEFFLEAVISQADDNGQMVLGIRKLYENTKDRIRELTNSQYWAQFVDSLFNRPIFRVSDLTGVGIPAPSARQLLGLLVDHGVVHLFRKSAGRRAAMYIFQDLIDLVNSEGSARRRQGKLL